MKLIRFIGIAIGFAIAAFLLLAPQNALAQSQTHLQRVYPSGDTGQRTVLKTYVSPVWEWINPGEIQTLSLPCPSDAYPTGGGFDTEFIPGNSAEGFTVIRTYPESRNAWRITVKNQDESLRRFRGWVICAD